MTRLTVNIDSKKSEQVVTAVLKALGLSYEVDTVGEIDDARSLTSAEQALYDRLKHSFEEIRLHQEGKIELKTIEEVLAELS